MFPFKKYNFLLYVLLPLMGYSQNEDKTLQVNIHPNTVNPMLIHIRFDNHTEKMAVVSIKDPKNKRIYKKWTGRRQFSIKFDTQHLPSGTYTITVDNKDTKIVKHIDVKTLYKREERRIAKLD